MSPNSDEHKEIACPHCGLHISANTTWCPHCNRPVLTQRRAKVSIALGSVLTVILTYTAARATLVSHPRVLVITFYLVLAMLSAFITYVSYAFLCRRRLTLAEQGVITSK